MTAPSNVPYGIPTPAPGGPPGQPSAEVGRTPVPEGAPPPAAGPEVTPPGAPAGPGTHAAPPASFAARVWRGRPEDPAWARPGLFALLLGTLVLYLWDLGASGYANSFYSAAVQAGGESWKAFFFGSSDAANSITVDKPPAALWPMALSVRLFGLGSWQILVPEALMGVATVGVLYAAVRRRFSAGAGLIAGVVLAVTPVAALMFRFNNPDALLALLMVVAVYCVLRALEDARTKWLVLAGVAFGVAFLTKTLQAWLVLPPLAVVYAVCAPAPLRRRLLQLLSAGGAMVLAGGWWVAIVELWPASSRPYIGGSQDNSFLSLTFGYNGFGRITGNETGSVGGGAPAGAETVTRTGGGGWGETGIGRLFNPSMGGQIGWLLPAAFVLLAAGLWLTWRAGRTDPRRAAFLVWGGSLLITFVTFSFMSGIFHEYYNIALAPYIAALVGMGASMLWQRRSHIAAAATLAVTVAGTALWSYDLLGRSTDWHPWLRTAVLVAGVVAAVGLLVGALPHTVPSARPGARFGVVAGVVGIAAALGGPVGYTLDTVGTAHTGSIITAGPSANGGVPGGMRFFSYRPGNVAGGGGPGTGRGNPGNRAMPGMPGQAPGQQGGPVPGGGPVTVPNGGGGGPRLLTQGGPGGGGGLLDGAQVSAAMKAALLEDADRYTWVAATTGSQNQASYQLATGKPVMAMGGFNGSDPSPTLAQFQKYVADGRIHYLIGGDEGDGEDGRRTVMGGLGGTGTSAQITAWVTANYTAKTVGSTTVYDLTAPKG